MTPKKPRGGSSRDRKDGPTVRFTRFGGRCVKADELLRSEKARDRIRSMAELFRNDASRDDAGGSGRRDPRPDRPAGCLP